MSISTSIKRDGSFCSAILFDQQDALALADMGMHFGSILALTPSAEVTAKRFFSTVESAKLTAYSHAKCVVFARRALDDLSKKDVTADLPPSLRVMTRQSVWFLAFLVQRLCSSLPSGPWLLRASGGSWQTVMERRVLLDILLPRIWNHGLGHRLPAAAPPVTFLHRWLTRRAAGRLRRSGGPWVVASTRKLRSGFSEVLKQEGIGVLILKPTTGRWSDYRALMKTPDDTTDAWVLPVAPLSQRDKRVREASARLRGICTHFRDPDLAWAWSRYVEHCKELLPVVLGATYETEALTRASGARAAVAFEANAWWSAALLDGAGRAGVTRAVLNHNSHPPGAGAMADEVLGRLFAQRTFNELVDETGIWSSAAMTWPEQANFGAPPNTCLQSVRLDYLPPVCGSEVGRPFRVLHAGNYQNWSDFFPWVAETSYEYLEGMEHLANSMEGLDGIELTFRVRPKREVDADTLRVWLRPQSNVSVCDTGQDFLEQLASCDLLVSYFSTTVEQALQMGKPVLLWGSTQRYAQFPGRETLPSLDSRAAVYVVRRADALPAMLSAIRAAHLGRPLTAAECAPYRHPVGADSMTQWLHRVLGIPSSLEGLRG
jgi:hypothetical protein